MKRLKIALIFISAILLMSERHCDAFSAGKRSKNANGEGPDKQQNGSSKPVNVKRAAAVMYFL